MSEIVKGDWEYSDVSGDVTVSDKILFRSHGCNRDWTEAQTDANGRLVAAAPDLLEACQEMAEILTKVNEATLNGGNLFNVLLGANEAIAKARGE